MCEHSTGIYIGLPKLLSFYSCQNWGVMWSLLLCCGILQRICWFEANEFETSTISPIYTKKSFFFLSMLHKCSINIKNRTKARRSSSVLTLLIIIVVAILVVALAYAWNTHFLRFYNFCVSSIVSLPYNGLMNSPHFC